MSIGSVLLLGSDRVMRADQADVLVQSKYEVAYATDASEAIASLEQGRFNVLVTSIPMLHSWGVQLAQALQQACADVPIVLLDDVEVENDQILVQEDRIFARLPREVAPRTLLRTVHQAVKQHTLVLENRALSRRLEDERTPHKRRTTPQWESSDETNAGPTSALVGHSNAIQHVRQQIIEAAQTDITVLIHGETGTGKDIAAQLIHEVGRVNRGGPFVKICCPALPEQLLESELFGHEAGAFTGALKRKPGRLELACTGTAFLDEITEMSPGVQAKLLEVLEHKVFMRVGGTEPIHVDTRLVAATNVDPSALFDGGRFRPDLYFRLNQYAIHIPPLRERSEDIPVLVDHFIKKYCRMYGREMVEISAGCMSNLISYSWPGNIRELESTVQRFTLSGDESVLTSSFIQSTPEVPEMAAQAGLGLYQENEKRVILSALSKTRWNRREAAKILGISYNTLRRRIDRYELRSRSSV